MKGLKEVWLRLRKAGLTINLKKSDFGHAKIQYLGYVVGSNEVAPVDAKVKDIIAIQPPTSRREVQRFLGMVGYYRRFCENLSDEVAPLTSLTSSRKKFNWTDHCKTAFEHSKRILASCPVLQAPDFRKPFSIEVDASDLRTGAGLLANTVKGSTKIIANHTNFLTTINDFLYSIGECDGITCSRSLLKT
ncbi:uncharacterized protein [Palaemon carinicauda]|uniref:uncharacterized protein n=1 Tax=Palaemon carinicauda TaxID=392227 RepID=UPI0035B617D7